MAIGMGAALLGSAIIGGGMSAIGASKNSKAIGKATDAQVQANRDSLQVQREIYDQNKSALSPFMSRGNAAGDTINALLGIGGGGSGAQAYAPAGTVDYEAYVRGNPDALANWNVVRGSQSDTFGGDIARFGEYHYAADGSRRDLAPYTSTGSISAGTDNVAAAQNAFKNYQDSTGYRFRMDQGMDALNTGYAAKGALNSGAAQKAALQFGQNLGSAEFGNYLGYLGNQQGVGLSGASALAGVGQNYANNVTANNSSTANAIGQGALAKAQNTNNLLGNLSSSFGQGLGALSSFGGGGTNAYGISGGSIY